MNYTAPAAYETYDWAIRFSIGGGIATALRAGTPLVFALGSFSDNNCEVWKDAGTGNFFVNIRTTGTNIPISSFNSGVACPASGNMAFEFLVKGNWAQLGYAT